MKKYEFKKSYTVDSFKRDLKTVIEGLFIAIIIRSFIIQPFHIPSGSMYPTLVVGDYIFVTKYSYGYSRYSFPFGGKIVPDFGHVYESKPKRGDVAVFRLVSADLDYIKRVIGLPEDTVQMIDGRLYINDKIVERERIEDTQVEGRSIPTYIETLPNGVKHKIWETSGDQGFSDTTKKYIVPKGHYFMMGDNRDDSQDSRFQVVSYISIDKFIGPARFIAISFDDFEFLKFWNWSKTVRTERIGQTIE